MSELPKGWNVQKFDSIADIVRGVTYKKADSADFQQDGFMPLYRANNIQSGSLIESDLVYIPETLVKAAQVIQSGDIVVAMSSGSKSVVGKSAQWFKDHKVTFGAFCGVLRPNSVLDSKYVGYFTQTRYYRELLSSLSAGANINNLKPAYFGELDFPLAPLAEQKRIVEKLDEVLAQVDTIKARLDGIPALLKRFRQSVLASAVSGKLTEEWRGESDYAFHEEIKAKFPSSWKIETIDNIGSVKGGKRLPKGEELVSTDTGYPYIRAGQLKKGTVIQGTDARNIQMYLEPHVQSQISRYIVSEGDAYITIVGASIGDAGIIPASHNGANLTENAAKICEFQDDVLGAFLGLWLRSELIQRLIKLEIKSGAQGKLALMRIKILPFPRAAIEEQKEIVRLVDQYFAFADTIEAQVKKAQARVDNLTQSILAKAFRGELVPQDSNDEPADKLLERIAQARKEAEALAKAAKKAERKQLKAHNL